MRLHPQARAALVEAAGGADHLVPGRPGFDLSRARVEGRARSDEGSPLADERDAEIGDVPCRLYQPHRPTGGTRPVVVYLHGGGWALGGIPECAALCRAIAARSGWTVLAVDYRLAPEHPYPAALADVEAVLAALARCGPDYGIDATRLAVAADSAGANLAAAVALRARDAGAHTHDGNARVRAVPWRLQALIYPVVSLAEDFPSRSAFALGYGLDRSTIDWHIKAYVPDPADRGRPDVSPLHADTFTGLPPALVITAEFDPLRDEGEAYAVRLAEAGVPVVATRYLGMIHGFADLRRFDAADALVDQVAGALRRTVRPGRC